MSKWTEIRDNITDALNVDDVTEQVKANVTVTVLDEVMPIIEKTVDDFTETTKMQAKTEDGWCKIRDGIVFPFVLQGLVFVVKTVLQKTVKETA